MNTFVKLGLVAAFALGGAGAVMAEDAAATAAGAVKNSTAAAASTAVDATTTGSIGNYGSLISSMNAGAKVDLSSVTDASTVNFVKVSTLTDADPAAIDAALKTKADAMTTLHADIEANAALKAKLEAAGYSTGDVLAVEAGADGALTVYIDDRA
jgi:hypothetical protein